MRLIGKPCRITPPAQEFQDHRMAEVGRDLCRPSSPTKAGSVTAGLLRAVSKLGFERLQGWRLDNISGQPHPAFDH